MDKVPTIHTKTIQSSIGEPEVVAPVSDGKYDEFIMEELKRLSSKVVAEHTELDARILALEKQSIPVDNTGNLDSKLDKEEFANFVSMLTEETISPMQKEIDKCKKDIQCIESFLENLS